MDLFGHIYKKNTLQFYNQVYYTSFGIRVSGLWLKIDASRRQNDPRKRAKRVSMVRSRSKSNRSISNMHFERGSSERHIAG